MDDLRFYVLFNSISDISGRWEVDERLYAMELRLRLGRFPSSGDLQNKKRNLSNAKSVINQFHVYNQRSKSKGLPKKCLLCVRCVDKEISPSLTVRHHSLSLMMPNSE